MVSPLSQPEIPVPLPLTPEQVADQKSRERQMKTIMGGVIAAVVVILIGLGFAVYALLQPGTPTERIRDIFIIIVALESLVIGVALVILLIQLASLINLLQNEVRPILQATNETINTLRGTAEFLGENVVEPVIKLNGYLASIQRVLELMGLKQK
jgi:ABC-type Fe3+ transport system permease subunit